MKAPQGKQTLQQYCYNVIQQGWVRESGVICPFLYITFKLKTVKNEKIWFPPGSQGIYVFLICIMSCVPMPYKGRDQLSYQFCLKINGQITPDSLTHPSVKTLLAIYIFMDREAGEIIRCCYCFCSGCIGGCRNGTA